MIVDQLNSAITASLADPWVKEKSFRQEERARDARKAMTEYEAQAVSIREKTARLKALRLAKQAQAVDSKLER